MCRGATSTPPTAGRKEEYWAFANIFSQISFQANQFSSPDVKKLADAENTARRGDMTKNNNQVLLVREMFANTKNADASEPATNKVPQPKALGGP